MIDVVAREKAKLIAGIAFDEGSFGNVVDAIENAILAERQRCADIATKWANDDLQNGEVRLVAAYINRSILFGAA